LIFDLHEPCAGDRTMAEVGRISAVTATLQPSPTCRQKDVTRHICRIKFDIASLHQHAVNLRIAQGPPIPIFANPVIFPRAIEVGPEAAAYA
jgi:hypothetical protein